MVHRRCCQLWQCLVQIEVQKYESRDTTRWVGVSIYMATVTNWVHGSGESAQMILQLRKAHKSTR